MQQFAFISLLRFLKKTLQIIVCLMILVILKVNGKARLVCKPRRRAGATPLSGFSTWNVRGGRLPKWSVRQGGFGPETESLLARLRVWTTLLVVWRREWGGDGEEKDHPNLATVLSTGESGPGLCRTCVLYKSVPGLHVP